MPLNACLVLPTELLRTISDSIIDGSPIPAQNLQKAHIHVMFNKTETVNHTFPSDHSHCKNIAHIQHGGSSVYC